MTTIILKDKYGKPIFEYSNVNATLGEALEVATGCNIDLSDIDLSDKIISNIDIQNARMNNADFSGAIISDVNLSYSYLNSANFENSAFARTKLAYSVFDNSNTNKTVLLNCDTQKINNSNKIFKNSIVYVK